MKRFSRSLPILLPTLFILAILYLDGVEINKSLLWVLVGFPLTGCLVLSFPHWIANALNKRSAEIGSKKRYSGYMILAWVVAIGIVAAEIFLLIWQKKNGILVQQSNAVSYYLILFLMNAGMIVGVFIVAIEKTHREEQMMKALERRKTQEGFGEYTDSVADCSQHYSSDYYGGNLSTAAEDNSDSRDYL